MSSEPMPPSQRSGRDIPEALEEIIMACLRKSPSERPSALELLRLLERCPLEPRWTDSRAEKWWKARLPDTISSSEWEADMRLAPRADRAS